MALIRLSYNFDLNSKNKKKVFNEIRFMILNVNIFYISA